MSTHRNLLVLTKGGLSRYEALMPTGWVTAGHAAAALGEILSNHTEPVLHKGHPVRIPDRYFHTCSRLEAGRALAQLQDAIAEAGLDDKPELWNALAAQWLVEAINVEHPGTMVAWTPNTSDSSRWCFDEYYTYYYRHQIAAAYNVCIEQAEDSIAGVVLHGKIWEHGEVAEQLLSRRYIWSRSKVMEVARDALTIDTGAAGRRKLNNRATGKGIGSARHFASVMDQLSVQYDVERMTPDALKKLMPAGFF